MPDALENKVRLSRQVMLVCYATLLTLYLVDTILGDYPTEKVRAFVLLIKIVPLILFSPGLLRGAYKTCLWLCFVLLIYFTVNVTHLFMPDPDWLDFAETVLLVLLFITAMMYARWHQYQLHLTRIIHQSAQK
jgi:uncharacterized membrane protein